MAKLFCFHCQKESEHSEYYPCPYCGARGPWGRPVENSTPDERQTPEKRSPKLIPEAARRVTATYRESDAF